jgi:hypothetical protein
VGKIQVLFHVKASGTNTKNNYAFTDLGSQLSSFMSETDTIAGKVKVVPVLK